MIEWYGHILLNEVNKGSLTLQKLVEVTSVNGAKIFGFYPRKGSNLPGTDADFSICDMDREWTIGSDKIFMKNETERLSRTKAQGESHPYDRPGKSDHGGRRGHRTAGIRQIHVPEKQIESLSMLGNAQIMAGE